MPDLLEYLDLVEAAEYAKSCREMHPESPDLALSQFSKWIWTYRPYPKRIEFILALFPDTAESVYSKTPEKPRGWWMVNDRGLYEALLNLSE